MLFGAVLIRAVCDGTITLFVQSGRIRAITQGNVERIKIISCAELFCSELFEQSYITVRGPLRELEP